MTEPKAISDDVVIPTADIRPTVCKYDSTTCSGLGSVIFRAKAE